MVTRYAHQTGHHVERRFGWDCHGVPVVSFCLFFKISKFNVLNLINLSIVFASIKCYITYILDLNYCYVPRFKKLHFECRFFSFYLNKIKLKTGVHNRQKTANKVATTSG